MGMAAGKLDCRFKVGERRKAGNVLQRTLEDYDSLLTMYWNHFLNSMSSRNLIMHVVACCKWVTHTLKCQCGKDPGRTIRSNKHWHYWKLDRPEKKGTAGENKANTKKIKLLWELLDLFTTIWVAVPGSLSHGLCQKPCLSCLEFPQDFPIYWRFQIVETYSNRSSMHQHLNQHISSLTLAMCFPYETPEPNSRLSCTRKHKQLLKENSLWTLCETSKWIEAFKFWDTGYGYGSFHQHIVDLILIQWICTSPSMVGIRKQDMLAHYADSWTEANSAVILQWKPKNIITFSFLDMKIL